MGEAMMMRRAGGGAKGVAGVLISRDMTSNTAPAGTVSASGYYTGQTSYSPWHAFSTKTGPDAWSHTKNNWVQYAPWAEYVEIEFTKMWLHNSTQYPKEYFATFKLQGVSDDGTVSDITGTLSATQEQWNAGFEVPCSFKGKAIRFLGLTTGGTDRGTLSACRIYGTVTVLPA